MKKILICTLFATMYSVSTGGVADSNSLGNSSTQKFKVFYFDIESLDSQVTKNQCEQIVKSLPYDKMISREDVRGRKSLSILEYQFAPHYNLGLGYDMVEFNMDNKTDKKLVTIASISNFKKLYEYFLLVRIENICAAKAVVVLSTERVRVL